MLAELLRIFAGICKIVLAEREGFEVHSKTVI